MSDRSTDISNTLRHMFSLEGRRGIVTGGSGGLGLAIATRLADAGADIHALSRTGAAREGTPHPRIAHHACDLTDHTATAKLIDTIGKENGLDFLVNNAGITHKARFETMDPARARDILAVNVDAVMACCRAAYRHLKASSLPGRIVTISSMAAHLGFAEVVPYAVSKAAVLGLTRGLAVEWAEDDILVNSVAPGWFPSEMTRGVMDEARQQKILSRMPLHRFGNPEELAAMVLFLLSPSATYITGQDFAVDGGALAFGY